MKKNIRATRPHPTLHDEWARNMKHKEKENFIF